jgi:DNA-binding MarR family transcriptional regulator
MERRTQTAFDDGLMSQSDAVVLAARLSMLLVTELDAFFRQWGITAHQFNILSILYVHDPDRRGLPRGFLEARLVQRMPDVTRLLARLEAVGLLARHRPSEDQRTVLATLTDKGWNMVEQSHRPLLALNRSQFPNFSEPELQQFVGLIRRALDRPAVFPDT